jgi:subtilisin-like proprotein convertase family protein
MASFIVSAQTEASTAGQTNATVNDKGSASAQAFVMTLNARGEVTCRLATPSERSRIMQRRGEMHVIYAGAPRRDATGAKDFSPKAPGTDQLPNLQPSAGLRIVLHGTAQLDQNQTAKNAFIVAANHWEALISTPITVILDVDFGTTIFGQPFPSGVIGGTGSAEDTRVFPEVRDRLLANSPTAAESQLYSALPEGSVPTELSSNAFKSLTVRMSQANARALGFVPDIADPNAIPLGGADAGIGFNSAFAFDFDPSDGVDANKIDFDSVATHEIGHALGFVSESGGPVYAPTAIWDMFRFRPTAASIGTFATAPRIMSAGGTQVYFNGQTNTFGTQELRLSTGPDGSAGDGNQSSHWKDDDITFEYIGIMDPNIGDGETNPITDNDVKTIDSFGYSIGSPVPAPPPPPPSPPPLPPNDNFANATVIQDLSGATIGNSTGATKEAGEPAMLPGNGAGGRSVWFRWTSPVSGTATFDTEGSGYDTILAVSTGNSVDSLSRLNVNDDLAPGETTSSRVTFLATAGVTYQLAVDGFDNGNGPESGLIEINWSATGTATPPCTTTFSNPANIVVNDSATPPTTAAPYPASLNVAGLTGTIAKLTVTLNGLNHTFPDDLDILLVGPQGQSLIVLSDVGGGTSASVSLTLDDSAAASLPDSGGLPSGTFRPANVGIGDSFPLPAPTPPYNSTAPEGAATLSSVFNGTNPNGTWSLYVIDDEFEDSGSISSGWSLAVTTTPCALPTVQFDASIYTPAEGIGSKTVMVTRTGDTSGGATVNYTTSDTAGANDCNVLNTGNASSRCDYETTAGTLRFASGETSKSILIPIVDDVYAEGSENFTVTLSNASGATLGSPSTATVTISDNETTTGANPINVASFFVRLHYIDFLNREPDASGFSFWTDQITSCGTDQACVEIRRINVSAAFFLSIEFQETGYLVYRLYKAGYGNVSGLPVPIRFNEFLPDTQQIGQGVVVGQTGWEQVLENNKQAFATEFVMRSRFTTALPTTLTPAQFVDALFANAGVTPSTTDRTAAINEFGAASNTADTAARGRGLRRVAENSILKQQETNRAFVLMQYFGYLRRNADDPPEAGLNFDGYNFWLGKLNQFNGNFVNAEMVKAFIISGEYRGRFGP